MNDTASNDLTPNDAGFNRRRADDNGMDGTHMSGSRQHSRLTVEVEGLRYTLAPGERLTIGRGHDADVVLVHPDVSRRHAELSWDGRVARLRDLGSSNGTWIGGQRLHGYRDLDGHALEWNPRQGRVLARPESDDDAWIRLGGPDGPSLTLSTTSQGPPVPAPSTPTTSSPQVARLPHAARAARLPSASERAHEWPLESEIPQASGTSPASDQPLPRALSSAGHTVAIRPDATGRMTVQGATPQALAVPPGTLTIGRGLDNEIVVGDLLASRRHVRLVPRGDAFEVEDLGSRNGTYVNGVRVEHATLREGDLLAVGRTRFTLESGDLVASEDEGDVAFVASHLTYRLPDGRTLLDDVSFALEGSSLLAVIGPSGAGKSTLLKALTGTQQATQGHVTYDGRDLYRNYDDLRRRIGVVPQEDVVHPELTVRQALRYAAELRFPDDLDAGLREHRVDEVIAELGLTEHATTQVARLSGGQRKRTSVALELLTQPSLLFLDEPTSGLDPGLDKRVMLTLRGLADGGRTVVVITHNVASLGVCDRVLMLAPGGRVAYFGPPEEMLAYFHAVDHADVFNQVTDDPKGAQDAFRASHLGGIDVDAPVGASLPPGDSSEDRAPRQQSLVRQLSTLVRRQFHVLAADRGYLGFALLMPLALAALAMLVPGDHGLATVAYPDELRAHGGDPSKVLLRAESSQIMTIIVLGSVFMGLASTIRALVAERPIFVRERAVGLSSLAYIGSKVVTYGVLVTLQCALLTLLVVADKGTPTSAVVLPDATLETFVLACLTGVTCVAAGLALSSLARTNEQVMPMLVIAVMGALVFSGGLFDLDTVWMRSLASLFPSRWGLAMGAQTADVRASLTTPGRPQPWDPFWVRDPGHWVVAACALGVQFVLAFTVAWRVSGRRRSV